MQSLSTVTFGTQKSGLVTVFKDWMPSIIIDFEDSTIIKDKHLPVNVIKVVIKIIPSGVLW